MGKSIGRVGREQSLAVDTCEMRVEWLSEKWREKKRKREREIKLSHKYNRSEFGRALWIELTGMDTFSLPTHSLLFHY